MFRVGIGTDRHRLVFGRKLIIGGVHVEFAKGGQGHSDADVLAHSLIDALLGAAGLGDIGYHFPDTDPLWKDADSMLLLATTVSVLRRAGFEIINVDASVHLETPKLGQMKVQMAKNVAETLRIPRTAVNIKAKTGEGLDSVGKGDAIEAVAVAMVRFDEKILEQELNKRSTHVELAPVSGDVPKQPTRTDLPPAPSAPASTK